MTGFGIIGTGAVGYIHAQAIQALKGAELIGVYSQFGTERFVADFDCKSYSSLKEMGEDTAIDFVCICTPSGSHMEPAVQMAEAGKHLIIEKPLEVTLERSDRIIEAAEKAGVPPIRNFPDSFFIPPFSG